MWVFEWLGYMIKVLFLIIVKDFASFPKIIVKSITNAVGKYSTRFEYDVNLSAPDDYPMSVNRSSSFYHGSERIYTPNSDNLHSGWGQGASYDAGGVKLKPLPDRLMIDFFSYTENQHYKGEFELPYEKIREVFRHGLTSGLEAGFGRHRPLYWLLTIGVAPGGVISVWVSGGRKTEVFFAQAEKINTDSFSDEYIEKQLVRTLNEKKLQQLKQDCVPFGLWSRYHKRYNWQPELSSGETLQPARIIYLNGEFFGNSGQGEKSHLSTGRSVPEVISLTWMQDDKKIRLEVNFEQFETLDAFEKLGETGKKLHLEFTPDMLRNTSKVRLYNDEASIELNNFTCEIKK